MTEVNSNTPEIQFVPLSPEQVELVRNNAEAVKDLGYVAMEGVRLVGVVPGTEAEPAAFVDLGDNVGDRINVSDQTPNGPKNYELLGTPENALASLQSPEQEVSVETTSTLAEVAELLGFSDVLQQYDELADMLNADRKIISGDIDMVVQDLDMLRNALQNAAESGPWSGNYLSSYPDFASRITMMTQEFANVTHKNEARVIDRKEQADKLDTAFTDASHTMTQQLAGQEGNTSVTDTLNQAKDTLHSITQQVPGAAVLSDVRYAIDTLQSMMSDPRLTAGDAYSMTIELVGKINESHATFVRQSEVRTLTGHMDTLRKLTKGDA